MADEDATTGRDRGGHLWPKDREATGPDGVLVRYTVRGPDADGEASGGTVVLCAGWCCPDNFWTYLAPALVVHHRVVMLNYRGVGASTEPRPPGLLGRDLRAMDYAVERLAGDVMAVVDTEGIERATFLGHSMGCQVALEVYRRHPDRVDALVLVTGPYRSPLRTFYGSTAAAVVFPLGYRIGKVVPEPLMRLIPKLAHVPGVLDVAQWLRAIGPHTPREPMHLYREHFSKLEAGVALRLAQAMHRHDATEVLATIDVPVQVIVGTADTFTPPAIGHEFAEAISDCELVEIEEGTHCALLEFPREINAAILDFLRRRLAPPQPSS